MADTVNNPRDQIEQTARGLRRISEVYSIMSAMALGLAVLSLGVDTMGVVKERLWETNRTAVLVGLGLTAFFLAASKGFSLAANAGSQEAAALEGALATDRLAVARQADAAAPAEDKAE